MKWSNKIITYMTQQTLKLNIIFSIPKWTNQPTVTKIKSSMNNWNYYSLYNFKCFLQFGVLHNHKWRDILDNWKFVIGLFRLFPIFTCLQSVGGSPEKDCFFAKPGISGLVRTIYSNSCILVLRGETALEP